MGWGFRKRVKILPGVYINLSKSGISASVGAKGITYNYSKRGTTRTISIPGTGLYHKEVTAPSKKSKNRVQYTPSEELLLSERLASARYYIQTAEREAETYNRLFQRGAITGDEFLAKITEIETDPKLIEFKEFIHHLSQPEGDEIDPPPTFPFWDIIMWACILVLAIFFLRIILK